MSIFYVLPPRPLLGQVLADYLATLFPGFDWTNVNLNELAESLGTTLADNRPDVYVVYRDDLPEGEDPARALADGFGAEAGDEIIEIAPEAACARVAARRWRLDAA